jgi:hypothetical protein
MIARKVPAIAFLFFMARYGDICSRGKRRVLRIVAFCFFRREGGRDERTGTMSGRFA